MPRARGFRLEFGNTASDNLHCCRYPAMPARFPSFLPWPRRRRSGHDPAPAVRAMQRGFAMRLSQVVVPALLLTALAAPPAGASFHLMQVEQVIGGVNGHPEFQAVQLRMRTSFQNLMSN